MGDSTDVALYPVTVSEDFRRMSIDPRTVILGCVGDRGVKRVRFEVPRMCDEVDLGEMAITVHFVGAAGTTDWVVAKDVTVGEDLITFTWEPSAVAFEAEGCVTVNVRMEGGGKVFNSGNGGFCVIGATRADAHGSRLVDDCGNLIVITVDEGWC